MSWLLTPIGESFPPWMLLLAFPVVVYLALYNYLPEREDRPTHKDQPK